MLFKFWWTFVVWYYLIGLVIEEISEEVGTTSSGNHESSSGGYAVTQPQERTNFSQSKSNTNSGGLTTNPDSFQGLKDDPEAIRFVTTTRKDNVQV